jgi:hypothetical protein
MKTSELTGVALDWAVAKSAGVGVHMSRGGWVVFDSDSHAEFSNGYNDSKMQMFKPSTNWAQGGVIIERERISIEYMAGAGDGGLDVWVATRVENPAFAEEQGDTPLIASMRAYVASKLGDEVEIPDELLTGGNK